jgi:hypothetical protein
VTADAEAYATGVIAGAIKENGLEAAQFQVALKQVEALAGGGRGPGQADDPAAGERAGCLWDAFKMLRGRT